MKFVIERLCFLRVLKEGIYRWREEEIEKKKVKSWKNNEPNILWKNEPSFFFFGLIILF